MTKPPTKEATTRSISDVFRGYAGAYGVYRVPTDTPLGAKAKGQAKTVREPVTNSLWEAHVQGREGLGIIPIMEDDRCYWGAVDIDSYEDFDPATVVHRLKELGLPLWVFRSKSGGAHVCLFLRKPRPAVAVRDFLTDVASALGHAGAEVFPKQVAMDDDTLGNWLNMPYFNADVTTRFAYDPATAQPLELEAFLEAVGPGEAALPKWSFANHLASATKNDEWSDAPPCLQALLAGGERFPQGTRNDGLFSLAVFRRRSIESDEAWKAKVAEDNQSYAGPGTQSEVAAIIRSISRKDYEYRCREQPIASVCNRALCMTRRYGIGRSEVAITGLLKLDTEPPTWVLTVSDHRVRLTTEQLHIQAKFQRAIMEQTNLLVYPRKPNDWHLLLDSLLEKVQVVPMPEETRLAGSLAEAVEHWLFTMGRATSYAQLRHGLPYSSDGRVFFGLNRLLGWLARNGHPDAQDAGKRSGIIAALKELPDMEPGKQKKVFGRNQRLWSFPEVDEREQLEDD